MVASSHATQALFSHENMFRSSLALRVIFPLVGPEAAFARIGGRVAGAARLKHLPFPSRPRLVPFNHELPAKPINAKSASRIRALFAIGMGATAYIASRALRISPQKLGGWGDLGPITQRWIGNGAVNEVLQKYVSVFAHPILGSDINTKIQLMYFLSQLVSPLLIYTVEGYRVGNQATLLTLPSVFLFFVQLKGIGLTAPVYSMLSALQGFASSEGRFVPVEVARALVPAITASYILPSIMMFLPTKNTESWQSWIALWQFGPPLFSTSTMLLSYAIRWLKKRQNKTAKQPAVGQVTKADKESSLEDKDALQDRYKGADVPSLQFAYDYAFVVQATAHLATIAYAYSHPDVSLARLLGGLPNTFQREYPDMPVATELSIFFKYDMLLAFTAIIGQNLYTVWDLRRAGYIKTHDAVKAAIGVILGQVTVGAGATWAGLWRWRESVLSGLSTFA
jgi:hypothetical protein